MKTRNKWVAGAAIVALAALLTASTTINGARAILGLLDASGATHTLPFKVVANTGALPSSGCSPGEMAVVTAATLGQQIYQNSGSGTCVWTQQVNTGSSNGGGITVYSGTGLTLSGTLYFPIGGGATPSSTETNVDTDSPSAATITNMYVQLSAALGGGNQGVFTFRNNSSSQSLTCTISGASATNCSDTAHSFNVSQGDLLTIQAVFSGTIVVTPNVIIAEQFGTSQSGGTVNSGTANQTAYYAATGTALSGAGPGTTGQVWTSNGSGSAPSFQTASGGGFTLLEQHTASSSASLAFTTTISSTYDDYVIDGLGLVNATNGQPLLLEVSTDGGMNYQATSYVNQSGYYYSSGCTWCNISGSTTAIQLSAGQQDNGSSAVFSTNFSVRLVNPGSTALYKVFFGTGQSKDNRDASGATGFIAFGAQWQSTTAINAFRFRYGSGNITSGVIRTYGIAK